MCSQHTLTISSAHHLCLKKNFHPDMSGPAMLQVFIRQIWHTSERTCKRYFVGNP